ncbi:MAG TPA: DNA-directed RNA polymerase subunit alpha [Firmicutes bacterium]|nr:DNA-directed RNA polymerase subunit alpha [Candidatus Fermentithermobacillaceae bacterium]
MFELIEPRIQCEEMSPDKTYGRFVVEPLEEGYGVTLGNSLRRVLLSSLPGAAVTRVRIDGVLHEFTAIPGIREDVTAIILNLKSLVLKMYSPGMKTARIEKEGPGTVTGRDIQVDPDVEIRNPDVYITELDEGGSLYMELTIEGGRGYVTAEENKIPDLPLGTIAIDSRFTPITKVNFQVEDTRVGQRTDYDKLIMEVWTDGSIGPDEAIETAAGILIDHLELFKSFTDRVKQDSQEEEEPEEKSELDKLLEMPVEDLELSMRAFNCLKRAGINTLGELVQKTEAEISKVRNMGKKSLAEVKGKLAELGLAFRLEDE